MSEILIPPIYRPTLGLPLYWGDEVTGELKAAVMAYYNEALGKCTITDRQFELLRQYLIHHINAPCWMANPSADEEQRAQIEELRRMAGRIKTPGDIATYIDEAMDLGLDPL